MTDSIQSEWDKLVKQSRKAPGQPPVEPIPKPPGKRRGKWGLPVLFIFSLAALVLHFQGTLDPWPAKPTQDEIENGQKASLLVVSKAIHDYAAFHGKYPQRIAEVLPLTLNVDYRLTPDGFELKTLSADGVPIVLRGK
ncbi:hypothetical protein ABQJ54_10830 [Rhodanobacter sp. Si-c]|uniref:Type II secretion system protein GspG C-terminal domain-containing protein n=1 Tax=Rhodanobacter lycopersici TaxID=3162487 RepID=A0ABV3QEK0_9GAMM